ncbi:MAG: hemerythrin family protein [Pseudomonadota bacterium]
MSYAEWQERFSVGIPEVDREHKILFDLIGQLHDAYATDKSMPDMERVFAVLMEYVGGHFEHEREVFLSSGYPNAAAHIAEHDRFAAEVRALFARYRAGEGDKVCIELLALLNNWWHFHVLEDDADYGRHVASGGR